MTRPFKIPTNRHPLVCEMFRIAQGRKSLQSISIGAGLDRNTVHKWGSGNGPKQKHIGPTIENFDRCLSLLGYRLAIIPLKEDQSPP